MGRIGVKAWIYKGDILPKLEEVEAPELEEEVLESTIVEKVAEAESSDEVKEDVATQAGEVPQES
jgi:ribosomal protein S3